MKKVFLDNLPKYGINVNWKESVSHKVKFIYDDICGEIEIIDYDNGMLILKYENKTMPINYRNFQKCAIGSLIGIKTREYKFEVGEIINDVKSGKIKILEKTRINNGKQTHKAYEYECLICGNKDRINEHSLTRGNGCSVCANQKVLKGYNDLWTTDEDSASMLKFSYKGYEISRGSNKKELFICPNCGLEHKKSISQVTHQGLSCICGDGVSYSEKFITEMFNQINIIYKRQEDFKWSNNKKYDFYVPSLNCIVEAHGGQHYKEGFITLGGRTLEEEQWNDKLKKQLAKDNGIKHYIVIDCRKSDLEWIKNSVLNSNLNKIFELTNINWLKCHEFACKSMVKEVCDLWNDGVTSIKALSSMLDINRHTIRDYLKKGSQIGMCDYKPITNDSKVVIQLDLNGNFIKEYKSAKEVESVLGIKMKSISSACRGECKTLFGYRWIYKENYFIECKDVG